MDGLFWDYLQDVTDPFVNPQKRVFVGYLMAALVIGLTVQVIAGKSGIVSALKGLLSPVSGCRPRPGPTTRSCSSIRP